MSDLVQRLHEQANGGGRYVLLGLFAEAADRIEALEAKVREQALNYLHLETGHELARQTDEVLLRQALDALESETDPFDCYDETTVTIAALRKRLGEEA